MKKIKALFFGLALLFLTPAISMAGDNDHGSRYVRSSPRIQFRIGFGSPYYYRHGNLHDNYGHGEFHRNLEHQRFHRYANPYNPYDRYNHRNLHNQHNYERFRDNLNHNSWHNWNRSSGLRFFFSF